MDANDDYTLDLMPNLSAYQKSKYKSKIDIYGVSRYQFNEKPEAKAKSYKKMQQSQDYKGLKLFDPDYNSKNKNVNLPYLDLKTPYKLDAVTELKPLEMWHSELLDPKKSYEEKSKSALQHKKAEMVFNKLCSHEGAVDKRSKKVNYAQFMHIVPRVGKLGTNFTAKTSEGNAEYYKIQNEYVFVENKPIIKRDYVLELANFLYRVTVSNNEHIFLADIRQCFEFARNIHYRRELSYLLRNNLLHERYTTFSLIIKIVDMESETLTKQNVIKKWIAPISVDTLLRNRLLLIIQEAASKGPKEVRELVLVLDSGKEGYFYLKDVLKHFDDELYNEWFLEKHMTNVDSILELEKEDNNIGNQKNEKVKYREKEEREKAVSDSLSLSREDMVSFITFYDFFMIYFHFRNDKQTAWTNSLPELKRYYDFDKNQKFAVFNYKTGKNLV